MQETTETKSDVQIRPLTFFDSFPVETKHNLFTPEREAFIIGSLYEILLKEPSLSGIGNTYI